LTLAVADGGHKEIAELLITEGADVNGKDDSYGGGTPLHMATIQDRKEVAELLIAKGSDVNAMDNDGQTPLDWTIIFDDNDETADLLRKHGGKTSEELKTEGK
jgi:serine/threonine-protein phosphatase 6 regulatory ankyrin repeat subunit B